MIDSGFFEEVAQCAGGFVLLKALVGGEGEISLQQRQINACQGGFGQRLINRDHGKNYECEDSPGKPESRRKALDGLLLPPWAATTAGRGATPITAMAAGPVAALLAAGLRVGLPVILRTLVAPLRTLARLGILPFGMLRCVVTRRFAVFPKIAPHFTRIAGRFVLPAGVRTCGCRFVIGEGVVAGRIIVPMFRVIPLPVHGRTAIIGRALIVTRLMVAAIFVAGNVRAFVAVAFVRIGVRGAEAVVAGKGTFLGKLLGIGVIRFRALRLLRLRGAIIALMAGRAAAALAVAVIIVVRAASTTPAAAATLTTSTPTSTTPTTLAATTALAAMALIGVVAPLGRALIFVGTARRCLLGCGRGIALAALRPGGRRVFAVPIVFLVLLVEILGGRRRGIGGAGAQRGLDGFRFLREILARGELHVAGGDAGEVARAEQARGLTRRSRADDQGGDDVAGPRAEKVFDGLGDQFRVDGALRVEREGGFRRSLGIGAGVKRGGADAVAAQLVKERIREVVETAFDGGGDGAARGGAIAIPAQHEEVALLLAQPRQRHPREGERRQQADIHALDEGRDWGIQQRRGRAARGVNDKTHMAFARHDILGDLGQGGGISEVASEGDEIVVRKRVAGELGGECIHPAAHADQAPANGEARPGVGAGD